MFQQTLDFFHQGLICSYSFILFRENDLSKFLQFCSTKTTHHSHYFAPLIFRNQQYTHQRTKGIIAKWKIVQRTARQNTVGCAKILSLLKKEKYGLHFE